MMTRHFVYVLIDPRTDEVRYVGCTIDVKRRIRGHLEAARTGHQIPNAAWIRELLKLSLKPRMEIVEVTDTDSWEDRERYWIAHFEATGARLTNVHAGGIGRSLIAGRWSRYHDSCVECGRTDRRYAAHGLCNTCYNRKQHRAQNQPDRPYHQWSLDFESCVECGTSDRPHKGMGLCTNCYARQRRRARLSP